MSRLEPMGRLVSACSFKVTRFGTGTNDDELEILCVFLPAEDSESLKLLYFGTLRPLARWWKGGTPRGALRRPRSSYRRRSWVRFARSCCAAFRVGNGRSVTEIVMTPPCGTQLSGRSMTYHCPSCWFSMINGIAAMGVIVTESPVMPEGVNSGSEFRVPGSGFRVQAPVPGSGPEFGGPGTVNSEP